MNLNLFKTSTTITIVLFLSVFSTMSYAADIDALIERADNAFHGDRYEEAVRWYKEAIAVSDKLNNQQKAHLYCKMGFSYGELKKWDKGLAAYQKGAGYHTDTAYFIWYKNTEAEEHWKKACALRKENKPGPAIEEFLKAQALEPENPIGYYETGWVYEKLKKDTVAAIKYFKKAMKVKPDYVGIGAIATVNYFYKNWQEAWFYSKCSLYLNPDNKHKDIVLKRIAECEKHLAQ